MYQGIKKSKISPRKKLYLHFLFYRVHLSHFRPSFTRDILFSFGPIAALDVEIIRVA